MNRPLDAQAAARLWMILHRGDHRAPRRMRRPKAIIAEGKKNLRLLLTGGLPDPSARPGSQSARGARRSLLVQGRDAAVVERHGKLLRYVTKRGAGWREMADLRFAFRVAKHVNR